MIALDKPSVLPPRAASDRCMSMACWTHRPAALTAKAGAPARQGCLHPADRLLDCGRAVLTAAFREKTARKIYWALVLGEGKPRIARSIFIQSCKAGEKMAVDYEQGQKALTIKQSLSN